MSMSLVPASSAPLAGRLESIPSSWNFKKMPAITKSKVEQNDQEIWHLYSVSILASRSAICTIRPLEARISSVVPRTGRLLLLQRLPNIYSLAMFTGAMRKETPLLAGEGIQAASIVTHAGSARGRKGVPDDQGTKKK